MLNAHVLVVLFSLTCVGNSARILAVFPLGGHSHYLLGNTLLKALAEKGHDVTMLSPFEEKVPPKNGTYRNVVIDYASMQTGNRTWNMFKREGLNPFLGVYVASTMTIKFLDFLLQEKNVQELLNSDEKFDVVIVDNFMCDAFKAFALRFDAQLVVLNPVGANFLANPLVGNPSPPSYIPDYLLNYAHPMTFLERMVNGLIYVFSELLFHVIVYPAHADAARKYIPGAPNLYDILYNVSLVLMPSHSTTNQPVPMVPNMIEIGGFHIAPPQQLPPDLREFFDSAEHGVIYFSLGSNLKSIMLPEEKRNAFLKAFSKLQQKVLWKWEDDELPGQPSNVKVSKWVPQRDVLAHPNLKLFITHGGFTSNTETAYHGVPLLAIPIFGDQPMNANFAYKNGFGRFIPFRELSEEALLTNINELLNNAKYIQNAKKRSEIFHDRLVSPMDTAVFWVEYVIRHRGAPHLRVAALDLPWYKYHLLDVIAFIALIVLVGVVTIYYGLRRMLRTRRFSTNKKIDRKHEKSNRTVKTNKKKVKTT